jgi:hypothetical protein
MVYWWWHFWPPSYHFPLYLQVHAKQYLQIGPLLTQQSQSFSHLIWTVHIGKVWLNNNQIYIIWSWKNNPKLKHMNVLTSDMKYMQLYIAEAVISQYKLQL